MRSLFALGFPLFTPHVSLPAAEPADLGQGLVYLRAETLGDAIPSLGGNPALVLDLRRVTASGEAVPLFAAALAARPAGDRLFVLVSPDTPPGLAPALKAGKPLILGIKGSRPTPDVTVLQAAADDRRAYDALSGGTALAELISGKVEKERYDEASLVEEFKQGHVDARPPVPAPTNSADTPPRLTDRVLQRAVHLHRAMQALKR